MLNNNFISFLLIIPAIMKLVVTLLQTILLYCYVCNAYKVLIVFPLAFGKSHAILGEAHVTRLLEAGHEVSLFVCSTFHGLTKKVYSVSRPPMTLLLTDIAKKNAPRKKNQ